jgi:hypothetical protein
VPDALWRGCSYAGWDYANTTGTDGRARDADLRGFSIVPVNAMNRSVRANESGRLDFGAKRDLMLDSEVMPLRACAL